MPFTSGDLGRYQFLQTGEMELVRAEDTEMDDNESISSTCSRTHKKQSHCVVEKRRRDKMNIYISELAALVPHCAVGVKKMDKLSVLRQTVNLVMSIKARGDIHRQTSKPSYIPERTHQNVLSKAVKGFVLVVGCNHGRVVFTSDSVTATIGQHQSEIVGKSIFDFVHPNDMKTLKKYLSPMAYMKEKSLDQLNHKTSVKIEMPTRLQPNLLLGDRRSFILRMKRGNYQPGSMQQCMQSQAYRNTTDHYIMVQCTGYVKTWTTQGESRSLHALPDEEMDADGCGLNCLVAVVTRVSNNGEDTKFLSTSTDILEDKRAVFVSRHATDGTFTSVDERVTPLLGYLPEELIGDSIYHYYHHSDVPVMGELHREVLKQETTVISPAYRFKTRVGHYATLKTEFYVFRNPSTFDPEFVVATNTVVASDEHSEVSTSGLEDVDDSHGRSKTATSVEKNTTAYGSGYVDEEADPNTVRIGRLIAQSVKSGSPKRVIPDSSSLNTPPASMTSSHPEAESSSTSRMGQWPSWPQRDGHEASKQWWSTKAPQPAAAASTAIVTSSFPAQTVTSSFSAPNVTSSFARPSTSSTQSFVAASAGAETGGGGGNYYGRSLGPPATPAVVQQRQPAGNIVTADILQTTDTFNDLADFVNESADLQAALNTDDDFSSLLHSLIGNNPNAGTEFNESEWPSGL